MSGSSQPPTETSIPTGDDLAFAGVARLSELLRAGDAREGEIVAGRGGRFGRPLR